MRRVGAVILAAGKGTRMRSRFPKVTHRVCGRTMIEQVLRTADEALGGSAAPHDDTESADGDDHSPRYVIVVGHESEQVRESLRLYPHADTVEWAIQEPQLGTADAVQVALAGWSGLSLPSTVLVLYGDTPLVTADTVRTLVREHEQSGAVLTFLTALADDPAEYGRVLRDENGSVTGIVERKEATPEQLAIREINSGMYCFEASWLASRLSTLAPHSNGEYYLTDLINVAAGEGARIGAVRAAFENALGINDRVQLAEADAILRQRILRQHMLSGVTIVDPGNTYIEADVRIGQDTIVHPGTILRGATMIGERCEIGPFSTIRDCVIADECVVAGSWLEGATMERQSRIGPMSRLRQGAHLLTGANLGNFAEAKNSVIGRDVQMHHFSYMGDAHIGDGSNIGAGTITCNYDGVRKNHTEIGERVFLGSDTLLVAPVTIGDDASTGAGSVVTHDVPPEKLVAGVPARVIRRVRRPDTTEATNTRAEAQSPTAATSSSPADTKPNGEVLDMQASQEASSSGEAAGEERE